jgi:hypothetical protein
VRCIRLAFRPALLSVITEPERDVRRQRDGRRTAQAQDCPDRGPGARSTARRDRRSSRGGRALLDVELVAARPREAAALAFAPVTKEFFCDRHYRALLCSDFSRTSKTGREEDL